MDTVGQVDIREGFKKLGIIGGRVIIHSSLSSFGRVDGGAEALRDVITASFETVLIPAFCWDSVAAPPEGDRPERNGCDYIYYDSWGKTPIPFMVENARIEPSMGALSRSFISLPQIKRSDHAWHSWAAYGDKAECLVENHPWDTTNLPIERLTDLGGHIVLLGVGLNSCTAVHVAEEKAGRRPFIRWAMDRDGQIRRVRASGCAKGFNGLLPYCMDLSKEAHIGECRVLVFPLRLFIERMTSVILSKPEITRCSGTCIRCHDALLGGPAE